MNRITKDAIIYQRFKGRHSQPDQCFYRYPESQIPRQPQQTSNMATEVHEDDQRRLCSGLILRKITQTQQRLALQKKY